MQKTVLIYEGNSKRIFATDDPKYLVVAFKDDAIAFHGEKKSVIDGKGVINNTMSNIIFKLLEENGIKTHYVEQLNERETLIKAVEKFPLEVIIRNCSAGTFSSRYGVEEGVEFETPTFEFSYPNDDLGDPLMAESHAVALKIVSVEQIKKIKQISFKVNDILKAFFIKCNLRLIDFKIEFGFVDGELILVDEFSPDTCRIWDSDTNKKLDKDRFVRELGDVKESYEEVYNRITSIE